MTLKRKLEETYENQKMTVEEVEETIQELIKLGLVEDSGKRRNGKIVWRLTKLGHDRDYRDKILAVPYPETSDD